MRKTQSIIAASLGTAALIATFTLAGAGAANASTPSGSASGDSSAQSCWIDADTGESLCVPLGDDLVAAVQQVDGVAITVPTGATLNGVSSQALKADASASTLSTAATTVFVSELFDDINYGGGSTYMSGSGCGAEIPSLVPYSWNDRSSSFKSFDGCETAIYQNINYGGTRLGYYTNKASFGSMNDAASSWRTE
jgi:hypothetical protein